MNKLVECVLPVCAWLSPDNWAGLVVAFLTAPGNILPIALHIALLEVGGKSVHVLQEKHSKLNNPVDLDIKMQYTVYGIYIYCICLSILKTYKNYMI